MRYCVPDHEDEVEEELARQDKRSLRDITTRHPQDESIRLLFEQPLLDYLVGIPQQVRNEPYELTKGLMFIAPWKGYEVLMEFMGVINLDGESKFLFRSMTNRVDSRLHKVGNTYEPAEYIDIAVHEDFLAQLTKRAHVRTSAQTSAVSKYLVLIRIDEDSAPTVIVEPLFPGTDCRGGGGDEIIIFTDGSLNDIKEVEHSIFGGASGADGETQGASAAVVFIRKVDSDLTQMHRPTQLIRTPNVNSNEVLYLTPYLTEAIAIIGALSEVRRVQNFQSSSYQIFSDCESLVKAIHSTLEVFNPISLTLTPIWRRYIILLEDFASNLSGYGVM